MAFFLKQKIIGAMAQRRTLHRLRGPAQLENAYLSKERLGVKFGRGSAGNVPFVGAVPLKKTGNPLCCKLTLASVFTSEALSRSARNKLVEARVVSTDGSVYFAAVIVANCLHKPIVVGECKLRDLPEFKWVHMVLGNRKTSLAGALHPGKYSKCV